MLIAYQQQVRRLLNDPSFVQFNDFDIVEYINQARRQIALDSEVLRQPAELTLSLGQQAYALSSASYVAAPTVITGLGNIVLVRSAALVLPGGFSRLEIRPWEWFEAYEVDKVGVLNGQPKKMAQQLMGAGMGTLWFAPPPDAGWVVRLYPVCLPLDLIDDSTAEALPMPWRDAVPYYTAHLAYLSVGNKQAADDMWDRYSRFQDRSNSQVTGTQLPQNFPAFRRSMRSSQEQGEGR